MTTLIQARVDSKLKEEAESIMSKLGITLNEAIRMFLTQVIIQKGIPFRATLKTEHEPNERLQQVIADVEAKKDLTHYKNTDELWEDLGL
ncbi:MAG: type II toxin-antitoxin system RelB/DinJ family antitoxin [Alphaproteobacteria bacterium]|nr:type II toxin-antitoxin system RelB/DinJ family antitoxin [Alphaproteobacteria bacterium]MBQ9235313.1 type II toxin-antitoxin system RelB/DinJ family antitoxin [Alphaproteobacteria bacterium]